MIVSKSLQLPVVDKVVTPIPGNLSDGAACTDGNGQVLYAALDYSDQRAKVYVTSGGPSAFISTDGSVSYLATITTDVQWSTYIGGSASNDPFSVSLTRIDGIPYATITGKVMGAGAGTYLYRDTSAAGDGSGPWVRQATIYEGLSYWVPGGGHDQGGFSSGWIYHVGNTWVSSCAQFWRISGTAPYTSWHPGIAVSTDSGHSWTPKFFFAYGVVGGPYVNYWSRGFARIGSKVYASGQASYAQTVRPVYSAPADNPVTWTREADGYMDNISAADTKGRTIGWVGSTLVESDGPPNVSTGAPGKLQAWSFYNAAQQLGTQAAAAPILCDLGKSKFAFICCGKVLACSSQGWMVGRVAAG